MIGLVAPDGKEDEDALKAVDRRTRRPGAEAGLGKHHNSPGGSVEAATESAATQTVDRLVLEIENDRVVRSDVSVELGRPRPEGGLGLALRGGVRL